jgi:hypothetical protein
MMVAKNLQYQHPDDAGKFRVVETDNIQLEDYAQDESFCGPTLTKDEAEAVAELFNANVPRTFDRCWKVVPSGYTLRKE